MRNLEEVPRTSLRLTMRGEAAEQLNQASAVFERMMLLVGAGCPRRCRMIVARAQACPATEVDERSKTRLSSLETWKLSRAGPSTAHTF